LMARDDWTPTAPALGIETLYLYMIAASFELFGVSVWSLRLPGALLGVATPIAVFAFARHLLGRRVALVACALAASSPWLIVASREARHANWVGLLVPLTYAVLLGALRRGRRRDYAIAGVLLGLSFHAYSSYRHGIPVAIGLLWLHRRWFGGTEHAAATPGIRWRWLTLGMLVPVVPALPHVLAGAYADWTGLVRDGTVGVWGLAANVLAIPPHVVLLRVFGDPGLGLVFGLLLASALPLLLRVRDPRGVVLGVLAVAMIAPPMVAAGDTLAARRYAALVPVLFPLMATALVAVVTAIEPGRVRHAFVTVVVLAWLVCGGRTLGELAQSGRSTDPRQHVLRSAIELATDRDVVIAGGYVGDDPARQFLARCPGMIDPPEGQYAAIGRVDRDLWFLDEGPHIGVGRAYLGRWLLHRSAERSIEPTMPESLALVIGWSFSDLLAGKLPVESVLYDPPHRTLTVFIVTAEQWNQTIGNAGTERARYFVTRAGRYAIDGPAGRRVHVPLSCGLQPGDLAGPPRWVSPSDEGDDPPTGQFMRLTGSRLSEPWWAMAVIDWDVEPRIASAVRPVGLSCGDVQDLAADGHGGFIVVGTRGVARLTRDGVVDRAWGGTQQDRPSTSSTRERAYERRASVCVTPLGDVVVARPSGVMRFARSASAWTAEPSVSRWPPPVDVAVTNEVVNVVNEGIPFVFRRQGWTYVFDTDFERFRAVATLTADALPDGMVGVDVDGSMWVVRGNPPTSRDQERRHYCGLVGDDVRICASASGRIAVCVPTRRMVRFFDTDGHALAFKGDPAAFDAFHLAIAAVVWADDGLSFTAVDRDGTLYDVRLSP